MKDKTIKNIHFDYANELVKILGFRNLSDFEYSISYDLLKKNQEKICFEFNKTIDEFKKLFPQEGFDLRKIQYSFKTIDQIIGFIKKLFNYLKITWNYSKKNGIPKMRLIPPNNLYNDYIMNMRNNPLNFDLKKNTIVELNENVEKFLNEIPLNLSEPNKPNETIKMSILIDKFEKIKLTKKYVVKEVFKLQEFEMDWIENIKILIFTENIEKKLPLGTIIYLSHEQENIIIYKVDETTTNEDSIKIALPDIRIFDDKYGLSVTNFAIYLPHEEYKKYINEIHFEIEVEGYNIQNKKSLIEEIDLNNDIIEFDHQLFYSKQGFDLGIFKNKICSQISKIGNLQNDSETPVDYNNFSSLSSNFKHVREKTINMKYIMNYLLHPFGLKYIIYDSFNLKKLTSFDYLYCVKIRNTDETKLSNECVVQLLINDTIVLHYEITDETRFDSDNYYEFSIDFLNKLFDSSLTLQICKNKDNYNSMCYDVMVVGSSFHYGLPKMISNSNIVFNHNEKWYIPGKKEYICVCGIIEDRLGKSNMYSNYENNIIHLFEIYKNKNMVKFINIMIPEDKKETLIFFETELDYTPPTPLTSNEMNIEPLFFMMSSIFIKYLTENNLLKTNDFSIGSNRKIIPDLYLCEIYGESLLVHYELPKNCDMLKHIDVYMNNYNSEYKIKAFIGYDKNIICDFGDIKIQKSFRLIPPNNKIITLLRPFNIYLVFEIPKSCFEDWKNINISSGSIFSDSDTRKRLSKHAGQQESKIIN